MTNQQLHQSLAVFITALGASMPKELAANIANNLSMMQQTMRKQGDQHAAQSCQTFAAAILDSHQDPSSSALH